MIINKKYYLPYILVVLICASGCASKASQLRRVSLDMSKSEVVSAIGEPTVARGGIRNKYGQVIEVWEYKLAMPSEDSTGQIIGKSAGTLLTFGMAAMEFKRDKKNYWLYFSDSILVQWGEAGDWSKEPERIYEFNFNPQPTIKTPSN